MRPIPTRIHGVLDYLVGIVLIAAPWLLGFADAQNRWAVWVPVAIGVMAIAYSLMTDYELGAVRVIPMPVHLGMDVMSGVVLAASPWLFGFSNEVYLPHLIVGLLEIGAGLMTQKYPAGAPRGLNSLGDSGHDRIHPAH